MLIRAHQKRFACGYVDERNACPGGYSVAVWVRVASGEIDDKSCDANIRVERMALYQLLDRQGISEIKVGDAEKTFWKGISEPLADRDRIGVPFGAAVTISDASLLCWYIVKIFTRNR